MGSLGFPELIIIFLVLLLVFGAKRIPEIARGIGKGIREFKDATNEITREIEAEGQQRQINQPQSPQQGQPQARSGSQSTAQEPSAQESTAQESSAQESSAQAEPSDSPESASQESSTAS